MIAAVTWPEAVVVVAGLVCLTIVVCVVIVQAFDADKWRNGRR